MDSTPSKRRKLVHDGGPISSEASSLAMKSEELVATVRVRGESANAADELLVQVKASLEKIEGHGLMPMDKAAKKLEKTDQVRIPFTDPRSLLTCSREVSFVSPQRINVVGSYFFKNVITTSRDHLVDMTVEIPAEMLRPNDYLDLRYFFLRAYFLAVMAAALKRDFGGSCKLAYDMLHGNALTPVLILRRQAVGGDEDQQEGKTRSGTAYGIRIIPCLPEEFFPSKKLRPTACLVRDQGQDQSAAQQDPTPFHNSTLKAEECFTSYLKVIRQTEKSCPSFQDACVLGRIWLQQRGFGGAIHQGGFGHFEWSVLLSLLLQSGDGKGEAALSTSLTALQLFKAMIRFLSLSDFVKKPLVLGSRSEDLESQTETAPVIHDTVRRLNIAFKMSAWSAGMLRHYAKWTHSLLTNHMVDQFSPTFITKADTPLHNFDMIVEVKHNQRVFDKLSKADRRGQIRDACDVMFRTLKRGLADKARLIHIWTPAPCSWAFSEDFAAVDPCKSIHVGILYDPIHMGRRTDRGPSVEDKNGAEKFQKFWGEKSELRRFKDGTTVETLLWESDSADGICEEMVRYLLMRHLQLGHIHDDLTFHKTGLDALVPLQASDAGVFGLARRQFGILEQDLRDLEELPLALRQLRPICPELRFASVKAPTARPSKSGPRPMAVVAYLEASGKWPDNLSAIQRVKMALLLKLGSLLEAAKPGAVATHLGLEDAALDMENLAFLDIVYESGYSFRLRLHSDMEESILERRTKDKTLDQGSRTESATLLATCKRMYTQLPLHSSTIQTYATRFPALSGTIRLLKTWFSSHALSNHFNDEFMELAALYVFVNPYPWDMPSCASTGFLRVLLFLAQWDWRLEALLVDTNGEMTPADGAALDTRLEAWRKLDPNMNHTVMFVATAYDLSGTAYTTLRGQPKPCKVAAARMTALARGAVRLVREGGMQLDAKALFQPSWKDYDVLIHLRRKAIKDMLKTYAGDDKEADQGRAGERCRFKNLDGRLGQAPLPLADHPVRVFLGQLAAAYAGPLLLFHGAEDDLIIGGIWNPLLQRRAFRTNLPCSYMPVADRPNEEDGADEDVDENGHLVEVNRDAILQEIARIGGHLVERIEVKGLGQ